jgi:cytochrome oxidase assembly protein ShyY1
VGSSALSQSSSLLAVDYRRRVLHLLTRPRYAALAIVALLVAAACVRLGMWQWHRHEERQARNAAIELSERSAPRTLDEAINGNSIPLEWSRVTAIGRYDASEQVLLRYRPLQGQRGFHVLVPLVTADGRALLVDRGFLAGQAPTDDHAIPEPPSGTVQVVGRVQLSEPGLGRDADTGTIRRVDLGGLADDLPHPLYPVWMQLVSERPEPEQPLQPYGPPSTGLGFHLSYAVQWWIFAVMALAGFVLLLRAEARRERQRALDMSGSEPR